MQSQSFALLELLPRILLYCAGVSLPNPSSSCCLTAVICIITVKHSAVSTFKYITHKKVVKTVQQGRNLFNLVACYIHITRSWSCYYVVLITRLHWE